VLVVFTGPSLPAEAVHEYVPEAVVAPPACRGDVDRARAAGASRILLIDGGFAHTLAVAPSEIVRALRAGVDVFGAASLGAIRAAECHPAGMRGLGAIQRLYRLRVLRDDDEVAVITEPDRGFRASSVALVNVRFAVLAGLRTRLLNRPAAEAILSIARRLHFSERLWDPILAGAGLGDRPALRDLCLGTDVKRRDALHAVAWLAANPSPVTAITPQPDLPATPLPDAAFANACSVGPAELLAWLRGSGRYRRHWSQAPRDANDAWAQLAHGGELEPELMRWLAVKQGVGLVAGRSAVALDLDAARGVVASAHGFAAWEQLQDAVVDGRLPGGVAMGEVGDAVRALTLARRAPWSVGEAMSHRQLHSGFRGFRHLHALQSSHWGTRDGAIDPV